MEVQDIYHYDPLTGYFTYKVKTAQRVRVGDRAGTLSSDGYWQIRFDGKIHRAGRLAFYYMTGRWPDPEIDHKDGNPLNDAWNNLREADSSKQKMNTKKRSDNTSGIKGVSWTKSNQKWQAYIHQGKKINLGYFESIEEAIIARKQAEVKYFGEFARGVK